MFKRKSYSLNQRPGCNTQEACGADGISLQAVSLLPPSWFQARWHLNRVGYLSVWLSQHKPCQIYLRWSHFGVLVWFLTKFGAVEQLHTRFVLWNHMVVVHHSALTALRFGLFVNQDDRHKCPHTIPQVNMEVFQVMMSISVAGVFFSTISH